MTVAKRREQEYVDKLVSLQAAVTDREQSIFDQQAYIDLTVKQYEAELQAQKQIPPVIVHVPVTSTTTTSPFAMGAYHNTSTQQSGTADGGNPAAAASTSSAAQKPPQATGQSTQQSSTADGGNPAAAAATSSAAQKPRHSPPPSDSSSSSDDDGPPRKDGPPDRDPEGGDGDDDGDGDGEFFDSKKFYEKMLRKVRKKAKAVEVNLSSSTRIKEADSIKLPQYPQPQQYRSWRSAVRTEVTAASGRGEVAFLWVKRTEGPATTFDDFRDSEGFDSLDAKLAAALTKIATGELGRRITLMVEQEASKERMLKGRQILWMIHDNHKLDEERGALYDFTDLLAIRLKGDNPNSCDIHRLCVTKLPSMIAQGKALTSEPTPSWLRP